jgi:hypothetical protein
MRSKIVTENFEGNGFYLVGWGGKLNRFERAAPLHSVFKGAATRNHRLVYAGSEEAVLRVLERGQDFRTGRGAVMGVIMAATYAKEKRNRIKGLSFFHKS